MTRRPRSTRPAAAMAVLLMTTAAACANAPVRPGGQRFTPPSPTSPVYVANQCSFDAMNALTVLGSTPTSSPAPTPAPTPAPPGFGHGGTLPDGFVPVAAISCGSSEETVPGDGLWRVDTQSKADSSLAPLLAALRLPSGGNVPGACSLELDEDPPLALIDAKGTALWVAPPRDGCDHIRPEVRAAINAIHWTVTRSQRVVHDSTQGGCVVGYKDMLSITPPGEMHPAQPGPFFSDSRTPKRLSLCVFDVAAGDSVPSGKLESEIDLTGDQLAKAITALDSAPPISSTPCTRKNTRFAVLVGNANVGAGAQSDQDGYVELDGCLRVGPSVLGGYRQLDAAAIATLTAGALAPAAMPTTPAASPVTTTSPTPTSP